MQIERFVRRRTWTTAATLAAIACATSSAIARPKQDNDPSDPPDTGGKGPVDRPHHDPDQKPQIPGYVLANNTYFRESTLPLCEWGTGPRSFFQFFYPTQEQQDAQEPADWACFVGGKPDTCSFSGGPAYRPTDSTYLLAPRSHYDASLQWPDGNAAYGSWGISCATTSPTAVSDNVLRSTFEGISYNGSSCGPDGSLGTIARQTLLAELVGGDVEHIRPATVRAQVNIGYYSYAGPRTVTNDLVLAIQVYGESGWQDFKTAAFTTGLQSPSVREVEATVPEGSAVRLQVRGKQQCQYHYGDGYDVRSMRILVETCIPDQTNPGTCL